jgi:hypothetical protein
MKTKQSHEGYLMIDDRASGGGLLEGATIMCAHCQFTWVMNPLRTRPRNYCRNCDAYVCDKPACNAACAPFWRTIEAEQTRLIHAEIKEQL